MTDVAPGAGQFLCLIRNRDVVYRADIVASTVAMVTSHVIVEIMLDAG